MLLLLDTKAEKTAAQKQLSDQLKKVWSKKENRTITWRPNSKTLDVVHDGKTGALFLMHSGKVGGGAKGVGKNSFLAWSAEELITIHAIDGTERTGILVAPVGTAETSDSIRRFVKKVADFKKAASGYVLSEDYKQAAIDNDLYNREHAGRKKGKRSAVIDYESRHGDVVHALREHRLKQRKSGEVVPNTKLIDLYVLRNKIMTEIYEVKTDTSRQALYTAIGQLLVHTGTRQNVKQFVVLPVGEVIPSDVQKTFNYFNVGIVRFTLKPLTVEIHPFNM